MIVLTGATGQLGSQIVDQLLARIPADQVGVSVRDTAKAAELAKRGVRVRRGDYSEPDTLSYAFEGADQVFVVSSGATGSEAVAQHTNAIDAARAAGAARVVYTSHQAVSSDSLFPPMRDHAATERYFAEQHGAFTSLRNGFYAATVPWLIGNALESGTLSAPDDGPVSWTTHADLAEAAAIALADGGSADGELSGPTAPLTGPETLDLEAVAGILSDLTGRRISRVIVGDDEWKAGAIAHGMPDGAAEFTLGIFRAARRGEFAVTDPALERILGRPAASLASVLEKLVAGQ
ncbi:NAD(P)H-binding protein [Spelaeicoccus albus]|uniref:Uncharacterized protein YbjT (DUF2867 family) n=1 Tax=Spelaeicoccus albus TaxID=1280376 RepID=A0A7Z0ACD7_9MICO|nr:NAD(P)H-binding protein [Spelaeicoccus albus]NYI67138.1 uncharacterized protein YbjT (DUF2867 family) [Spelaeicoccus albus]